MTYDEVLKLGDEVAAVGVKLVNDNPKLSQEKILLYLQIRYRYALARCDHELRLMPSPDGDSSVMAVSMRPKFSKREFAETVVPSFVRSYIESLPEDLPKPLRVELLNAAIVDRFAWATDIFGINIEAAHIPGFSKSAFIAPASSAVN